MFALAICGFDALFCACWDSSSWEIAVPYSANKGHCKMEGIANGGNYEWRELQIKGIANKGNWQIQRSANEGSWTRAPHQQRAAASFAQPSPSSELAAPHQAEWPAAHACAPACRQRNLIADSSIWLQTAHSDCRQLTLIANSSIWMQTAQSECRQFNLIADSSIWLQTAQLHCWQLNFIADSSIWLL